MKIEQKTWSHSMGWTLASSGSLKYLAQLVLVFGASELFKQPWVFDEIRDFYPHAFIFGCSTAGEICGIRVFDDYLVATAVHFEHSNICGVQVNVDDFASSFEAGQTLARSISAEDLVHVLLLSDGLRVNGSELVKGLVSVLPGSVSLTGGLAGDGNNFAQTYVIADGPSQTGKAAAVGFYGSKLNIGCGSWGGWDPFGPERKVTRSDGNVLYEMDGRSALGLYKTYLGEYAKGLPATGLYFPLNLRDKDSVVPVVRAIMKTDEEHDSLIFFGDVPEGTYVRLMKANIDRLIEGAVTAAELSRRHSDTADLTLMISCAARKAVMKQRTEEEIEAVQEVLGTSSVLCGFYSYGEICPHTKGAEAQFHNQTMTITTFSEE